MMTLMISATTTAAFTSQLQIILQIHIEGGLAYYLPCLIWFIRVSIQPSKLSKIVFGWVFFSLFAFLHSIISLAIQYSNQQLGMPTTKNMHKHKCYRVQMSTLKAHHRHELLMIIALIMIISQLPNSKVFRCCTVVSTIKSISIMRIFLSPFCYATRSAVPFCTQHLSLIKVYVCLFNNRLFTLHLSFPTAAKENLITIIQKYLIWMLCAQRFYTFTC